MYAALVMRHASGLTFGREQAQFHELLVFMAIISTVLWTIVLVTLLLRWYLSYTWSRHQLPADNSNSSSP